MNNPEKPNIDVESLDVLSELKTDIFRNLHCIMVGEIQTFDKAKKTAEIEIKFKRVFPDGTSTPYPQLVDCPVFTLQGGGAAVQLPIEQGDPCLVLFCDRNIDSWFQTGDTQAPKDDRCHNLSDGIALVGINSLASDLPDYVANTARLIYGNAQVSISNDLITLKNTTTDLKTLLTGLADIIGTLTTTGGPTQQAASAATVAAVTAFKLQLATLLSQ